jgi:hypothetical protein
MNMREYNTQQQTTEQQPNIPVRIINVNICKPLMIHILSITRANFIIIWLLVLLVWGWEVHLLTFRYCRINDCWKWIVLRPRSYSDITYPADLAISSVLMFPTQFVVVVCISIYDFRTLLCELVNSIMLYNEGIPILIRRTIEHFFYASITEF